MQELDSFLSNKILRSNDLKLMKWFKRYEGKKRAGLALLVSTYLVCERLSVMHEPTGVVEILVQILQNTPYSEIQFQNTPLLKIEI